jgi:hypothetical protein
VNNRSDCRTTVAIGIMSAVMLWLLDQVCGGPESAVCDGPPHAFGIGSDGP